MGIQYHLSMHRHNLCAFRTSEKSKENREWDEIECELKWTGGLKWAGLGSWGQVRLSNILMKKKQSQGCGQHEKSAYHQGGYKTLSWNL